LNFAVDVSRNTGGPADMKLGQFGFFADAIDHRDVDSPPDEDDRTLSGCLLISRQPFYLIHPIPGTTAGEDAIDLPAVLDLFDCLNWITGFIEGVMKSK
jgi:hypothetical protein